MKIIVAAFVSALLAGSAYAQAATPPSDTKVEAHIRELHGQLKITAAEETQWEMVAATMRDSAVQTDKALDQRKLLGDSATAVDSLNAYTEIAQAHADGVRKLGTAFAALYGAMPADQKQVADAVFARHPHHGRMASK